MSNAVSNTFSFCFRVLPRCATFVVIALSVVMLTSCSFRSSHQRFYEDFTERLPAPVRIEYPEPEEWELSNGLKVLFVRDDELPIVSGALFLRGGLFHAPEGEYRALDAMGEMLRFGGTKKLSAERLDLRLRELAASVSSGYSAEFGQVSFNSLSVDVHEVFPLFADVLLRPRFDEERLGVLKTQFLESIRRSGDDPNSVARITADYLLYKKSPFGSVSESSDVDQLNRLALLRAHRHYVRPDGAVLAITGSISREEVERLVNQHLLKWEPRGALLPEPRRDIEKAPAGIYFVEGDYTQAVIQVVQPGPDRHTRDRYAISLLNGIMGDGLDSRLAKKIRADLGLAYTVYGVVSPGYQEGKNTLFIQTKSESAFDALERALAELQIIQKEPPLVDELEVVQYAAQSTFVFRFTSPGQVLERMVLLDYFGYPADYDERYIENIFAVSRQDVSDVARRWWDLADFRIVVVASSEAIEEIKRRASSSPVLSSYIARDLEFHEIPREKPL